MHVHPTRKGCASLEIEFAIEPMDAFQYYRPSSVCPGKLGQGADHFPPHPPEVVISPYHYDSKQVGESLYLQQRNGQSRSEPLFFTVTVPFRIYSEMQFDFLSGDLSMDLMLAESTSVNIHQGVERYNRHIIAMDYLPPGRYVVYVVYIVYIVYIVYCMYCMYCMYCV